MKKKIWIAPCHEHDAYSKYDTVYVHDHDDSEGRSDVPIIPSDPHCYWTYWTSDSRTNDTKPIWHHDSLEEAQKSAEAIKESWSSPVPIEWEIEILSEDHPSEVAARRAIQKIVAFVAPSRAAHKAAVITDATALEWEPKRPGLEVLAQRVSDAADVAAQEATAEHLEILAEASRRVEDIRSRPYPWQKAFKS